VIFVMVVNPRNPTRSRTIARFAFVLFVFTAAVLAGPAWACELTLAAVNGLDFPCPQAKETRAVLIAAQVLLDRAGFSPGAIDGRPGGNFVNALRAFQQQNGLDQSGQLDAPTWSKLTTSSAEPVMSEYIISAEDVRGPFVPEIPDDFEQQAALKELAYTGPAELLAEKFHMDEELLRELNRDRMIDRAGTRIRVANVRRTPPKVQAVRLLVDKPRRFVRAFGRDGKLVGFFPASIGSEEKRAPTGTLKITRVVQDPVYYYNPKFRFPGVSARHRLKIAPGPNNPVGSVWMNLNERTYGIHGTAEPSKIGKTYSHGCVRLTNWDAKTLAAMVKKGTTVEFVE
jgi:lipoprotein-anchoring transpeptidase ErfK/SrfK